MLISLPSRTSTIDLDEDDIEVVAVLIEHWDLGSPQSDWITVEALEATTQTYESKDYEII